MSLRLVSWNIHQLDNPWRMLIADKALDVALLQEAKPPPADVACDVVPDRDAAAWTMPGYRRVFRTAVARLSDRVTMRARITADLSSSNAEVLGVSYPGTISAVDVEHAGETFTCVSAYALWQNVVNDSVKPWIVADASAHRLISDISTLIATERGHRLIIAGDFNLLRGYGENGSKYWARRYTTVFDRMDALGLRCLGPSAPNGRQADPWPAELPRDSTNVPTYRASQQTPASATRQLDYVFVSESLADRVSVHARNQVDLWGPSDHCQVTIEIADR